MLYHLEPRVDGAIEPDRHAEGSDGRNPVTSNKGEPNKAKAGQEEGDGVEELPRSPRRDLSRRVDLVGDETDEQGEHPHDEVWQG